MSSPTIIPDQQATSTLGSMAGGAPMSDAPEQGNWGQPTQPATPSPAPAQATSAPPRPASRLSAILSAVANVASTGLAGIPDKGRPSFVTGLGEGARAEQAAQATRQAIKFRDMDTQIRLAELHNQDLKLQNDTQ